jgi:glycerophosphoryl diester phosphodiesterase
MIWGRHEKPFVVAHRGASADEPENTLAAFRKARADGADAIEVDVMRCGTGEVVVFHDDNLERLAHRPGEIRKLSWQELSQIDISGQPIPLLSQVLEELGPMAINVELKSHPDWKWHIFDDGLAGEVAKLVRPFAEKTLVSSFDPLLLMRFRGVAPDIATGFLFSRDQSRPMRQAWPAPLLRPTALHPEALLVDQIAVDEWRGHGYAVHVWTVDDPAEIRCLAALGVDAVITNRPAQARKALNSVLAS